MRCARVRVPAARRRAPRLPGLGDAAARAAEPRRRDGRPAARRHPPHAALAQRRRPLIVVAPVRAALQPLAAGLARSSRSSCRSASAASTSAPSPSGSSTLAYSRVDLVTRRGEFAVRGGILDVFSPIAEHPVRIDFFGDEVDGSAASPSPTSARSRRRSSASSSCPPRAAAHRGGAAAGARAAARVPEPRRRCSRRSPRASRWRGWSRSRPSLVDRLDPGQRLPARGRGGRVLSPERVASRAVSLAETNREFLHAAWSRRDRRRQAPIDLDAGDFLTVKALRDAAGAKRTWWTISSFESQPDAEDADPARAAALLADSAEYLRVNGGATPVTPASPPSCSTTSPPASATAGARSSPPPARASSSAPATCSPSAASRPARSTSCRTSSSPGVAYITLGDVETGFEQPEIALAVVTEREFYGRTASVDNRQQEARDPPQERRRPAAAEGRRLRRAPDARHRPVRRAGAPRGRAPSGRARAGRREGAGEGHPRVPADRVRALQARLPGRQALRADRPARPAHPLRRRRGAAAVEDGRHPTGPPRRAAPARRSATSRSSS